MVDLANRERVRCGALRPVQGEGGKAVALQAQQATGDPTESPQGWSIESWNLVSTFLDPQRKVAEAA